MAYTPLVSVVVVTYNSSNTIIETLDSIKAQSYKNIELIISDDCSPDETISVVRKWLTDNSIGFVNTELVTSLNNTGVSGNLNRGIRRTNGEWIKSLAGDDLLAPTCINDFISFVESSSENIEMCVCDVDLFSRAGVVPNHLTMAYKELFKCAYETQEKQWKRVCEELAFAGPAYFYSRHLYDIVEGFSEKYGNGEEWPFVYKVLKNGYRIYPINKKNVLYRVSLSSLSRDEERYGLGNKSMFDCYYKFFFDSPFRDLIGEKRFFVAWHLLLYYKILRLRYKYNNAFWTRIIYGLSFIINPYRIYKLFVE